MLAGVGVLTIVALSAIGINAYGGGHDRHPPRLGVSFRGLDLTTREGLDLLDARIGQAVDAVCGYEVSGSIFRYRVSERCRADAWASVRPQVEHAIALARHGGVDPGRAPRRESVSVLDDIDAQPDGIRDSIHRALERSFRQGLTANWYAAGAHGFVYAGWHSTLDGFACRMMTVTTKAHGEQQIIASGPVCLLPDGSLDSPPFG